MELLYFKMSYQESSKERLSHYLKMWMCFNLGRLTFMASPSQTMTLTNLISLVQSGPGGEELQMRTGTGMDTSLCVSKPTLIYLILPLGYAEIFSENSVLASWCSSQVGWRTRTGTPGRGSRPVLSKGWLVGHWFFSSLIHWWYWLGGYPELFLEYFSARVPVVHILPNIC